MRTYLLCLVVSATLFCGNLLNAQNYVENFQSTSVGSVPGGWVTSSNTNVEIYGTPYDQCGNTNRGLLTPGVGSTAPVKLILPVQTFNSSQANITLKFSVIVLDATLKCNSMKAFPCPTYIKAYLVKSTINSTNVTLKPGDIYAEQPNYQIMNANASNTIVFNNVQIPNGANYRLLLDFKTAESNCQSGNTKFIFDDFSVISSSCDAGGCIPVANDDFFSSDLQGFGQTVSGNVFGGFAKWANQVGPAYQLRSLDLAPAVSGGLDKDDNNPELNTMQFKLVSGPIVEASFECPAPAPGAGTLQFNADGTFTYVNSNPCIYQVSFTYEVSNGAKTSGVAKVTIKLKKPVGVPLPVTLKSFNAKRNKDRVDITWQTAMELNNRGFEVQRKVGNGEWKVIAFVFSQADGGNSNALLHYEFADIQPDRAASQYRLRQVDIDTRATFSEIRVVRGLEQTGQLLIYPNPSADGKVNVVFEEGSGKQHVIVSDMTGRTVKQYRNLSDNSLQIDGLQNGMYTLQVINATTGETTVEKIVIKKR